METVLTIALVHLLACLSPGPDIFLVIRNSLRHGAATGLRTTLGILTGVVLHISLGIAGLSYLILQSPAGARAVALAGGAWLLFLGLRGLLARAPDRPSNGLASQAPAAPLSWREAWMQGLLVNLLNPKALLFFLSLFSVLLGPDRDWTVRLASGVTMVGVQAAAFSAVALSIGRLGTTQRWSTLQNGLDRAMSVLLMGIGLWIWISTLVFPGA